MNLIELLPEKDKQLMIEYINLYGVGKKDFIGLDEYLKHWDKSKRKLYKLFGNQFQVEIPFKYEKSECEMFFRFDKLLKHDFISNFIDKIIAGFFINKIDKIDGINNLKSLVRVNTYKKDAIDFSMKIKTNNIEKKKEIQLQKGMKPIRALQRISEGFPEVFPKEDFESFRLLHSQYLNDKVVSGTLVFSIHPLDFITMSDNNSDWSSCMSWSKRGCYRVGTVEMMNSNNTIITYIKSSTPYYFNDDKNLEWNNKKWRQLVYVTKDIICSGKPYPYENHDISKKIITELKKMAEKNMSWGYNFGPEKYLDMVHINSQQAMDNNRYWLHTGKSVKHNILFDTKGMYNDMFNDNSTTYWCYRNKVPKMRILSLSGKVPCLCCGYDVLTENSYPEDYNDRWEYTDEVVCPSCRSDGECDICGDFAGAKTLIKIKEPGREEKDICPKCANEIVKKCPCCRKNMIINTGNINKMPGIRLKNYVYYGDYSSFFNKSYYHTYNKKELELKNHVKPYPEMSVIPAYFCQECIEKDLKDKNGLFTEEELPRCPTYASWMPETDTRIITKKQYSEKDIIMHPTLSKMLFYYLEKGSFDF